MNNMLGTPGPDGVYFTVTAMAVEDNRTIKKAVRDKDGYFTGVPVAVIGAETRNKTKYDTASFLRQIKGPSTFNTRLSENVLFGELGHPFCDLTTQEGMMRLAHLEPKCECNHIRSVSVQRVNDLNIDLITIDTKGSGVYKDVFDEAMEDPTRNVAFSLRGLSRATLDRQTGITHKELLSLVTFDSMVGGSGFKHSSKRYMTATEDLKFESQEIVEHPVTMNNLVMVRKVAMESFSESELNEILKATKVVVGQVEIGYVDKNSKMLIDPETGQRQSLFNSFIRVKR